MRKKQERIGSGAGAPPAAQAGFLLGFSGEGSSYSLSY